MYIFSPKTVIFLKTKKAYTQRAKEKQKQKKGKQIENNNNNIKIIE